MGLYRSGLDYGFTPTDRDDLIAEKLWPIIKGIIMTCIENKQNIVIEGCYIMPEYINSFDDEYSKHIINIFLGFSNTYITNNFISEIIKNRCIIERRIYEENRNENSFIKASEELRLKCNNNNVNYFEIDINYNNRISEIMQFIDEKYNG